MTILLANVLPNFFISPSVVTTLRRGVRVPAWVPADAAWAVDCAGDRAWIDGVTYGSLDAVIAAGVASFARASSGIYVPSSGPPAAFAAGRPRRGDRGLLIEPAATNRLPYAVVDTTRWSVSALSGSVTEIGSEDFAGRSVPVLRITQGSVYTVMSVTVGTTYTASLWIKTPNPEHVGRRVTLRKPGEGTPPAYLVVPATSEWTMISVTKAAANNSYNFLIGNRSSITGETETDSPVDLAIVAQLETGAVATSQIVTTGAMATRAADALTLKPPAGTYNVRVTFDDGSTQALDGQVIGAGGWTVPTNLDRRYVAAIAGAAA